MNGLTRVAMSLLMLGACAIAIRSSMKSAANTIPSLQEPRFGLSERDRVKLNINAGEMADAIHLVKRNALGIKFSQTTNNRLALDRIEYTNENKQQLVTADFVVWRDFGKYLLGLPKFNNPLMVLLPPHIPIDIYAFMDSPQVDLDFRGLEITKFDLNPGLATPKNIALNVVASDLKSKSQLILRTWNQPVEIKIPKDARGTLSLEARGTATVNLFIEKGLNPKIIIYSTNKNDSPSNQVRFSTGPNSALSFYSENVSFDGEKPVSTRWGRVTYGVPRTENLSAELYKPTHPKFDYTIRIVVDANVKSININEVYVL